MTELAVVEPEPAMMIWRLAFRRSSKVLMFDCRRMNSTKLLLAELPIQVKRCRSYLVSAALMSGASTKPDRPGMPSVRPSGLATPKR